MIRITLKKANRSGPSICSSGSGTFGGRAGQAVFRQQAAHYSAKRRINTAPIASFYADTPGNNLRVVALIAAPGCGGRDGDYYPGSSQNVPQLEGITDQALLLTQIAAFLGPANSCAELYLPALEICCFWAARPGPTPSRLLAPAISGCVWEQSTGRSLEKSARHSWPS